MPSPYRQNFGITTLTSATETITAAAHAGQRLVFNRAAGVTATLPDATGSGNEYDFLVLTTVTSNSYIVQVPDASNTMVGTAILLTDVGDAVAAFATVAASDTVTFDGTTTGGIEGARIRCVDIAVDKWFVEVVSDASGTEVTPFSAAV